MSGSDFRMVPGSDGGAVSDAQGGGTIGKGHWKRPPVLIDVRQYQRHVSGKYHMGGNPFRQKQRHLTAGSDVQTVDRWKLPPPPLTQRAINDELGKNITKTPSVKHINTFLTGMN